MMRLFLNPVRFFFSFYREYWNSKPGTLKSLNDNSTLCSNGLGGEDGFVNFSSNPSKQGSAAKEKRNLRESEPQASISLLMTAKTISDDNNSDDIVGRVTVFESKISDADTGSYMDESFVIESTISTHLIKR